MAGDIWRSDRGERAAGLRISFQLRHEPLEQAKHEQDAAAELGGRLFWQLSFPLPISKRFPIGTLTEPPCSDNAVHPHHPARLKLRLEQTVPGCDWLLDRWDDLMLRLHRDDLWLSADAFKMSRLLGKHAIDMADDLIVARVVLCSLTLLSAPKAGPERDSFDRKNALIEMLMTFDVENKNGIAARAAKQCEPIARRLAELPLARLAPRDEEEARARLTAIFEQEVCRLRHVRETLQAIADADAAEAPGRLAFEIGPEGDRPRRFGMSNERAVMRRFDQFLKARAKSEAGAFDFVDADAQDLLGTAQPFAAATSVISPAGEIVDARHVTAEVDSIVGREDDLRDPLAMPTPPDVDQRITAPSPDSDACCVEDKILRNEAKRHRGDVRNEAGANGESLRNGASADLPEAMIDIERMRREFEKRTPFRAGRSRKPSDRGCREAEAGEAALRSLQCRSEHENGDRGEELDAREAHTGQRRDWENGARKNREMDSS